MQSGPRFGKLEMGNTVPRIRTLDAILICHAIRCLHFTVGLVQKASQFPQLVANEAD